MSIRRASYIVVGAIAALYFSATGTGSLFLRNSNRALDAFNDELPTTLSVAEQVSVTRKIRLEIAEQMAASRVHGTNKESAAFNDVKNQLVTSANGIDAYLRQPKDNEEMPEAMKMDRAYRRYVDEGLGPLERSMEASDSQTFDSLVSGKVPELANTFEVSVRRLVALREARMEVRNDRAQFWFGVSKILLNLSALAFLSLLGIAIHWLRSGLLASLDRTRQHCEDIARGNLARRVMTISDNEIGEMTTALEIMRTTLADTISAVREASDSVAHGSREIANGNASLSARTENQAATLQETAATMEQFSVSVKQTSDNAQEACRVARDAVNVAAHASDLTRQVVETMAQIDESSTRIAAITGLIENIAFQTNLLALNAAVEAARAGDHGRGFAVVAAAVRSLAQRSSDALKEIKDLVGVSTDRVQVGAALVARAGETMDRVSSTIRGVSQIITKIAEASYEQSQRAEETSSALTSIDNITQQNASLVDEAAAATDWLHERARGLREAVASFQLP